MQPQLKLESGIHRRFRVWRAIESVASASRCAHGARRAGVFHPGALCGAPVLAAVFRRRKHPVGKSWRMDETYIKVAGQWKYLYRGVDQPSATRVRASSYRWLFDKLQLNPVTLDVNSTDNFRAMF